MTSIVVEWLNSPYLFRDLYLIALGVLIGLVVPVLLDQLIKSRIGALMVDAVLFCALLMVAAKYWRR